MTAAPVPGAGVALRPVPYPYRAMLAICSDLDETPDREVYWEIARFLNATETTPMGPGVGLEVGNSIYFDMPPDQFAYWNTDERGREMVRALVRSGHIDCFHSFGDLATTRAHAARALDELDEHGCRLGIWIDHATAPSNFGADIMRGRGDVPGDEVYHADLTCASGVRYVWRGRVTSVIGQDAARSLRGVFDGEHAAASARTVAKELAKGWLGRAGHRKYAIHAPNEVLRRETLRDGQAVWEFLRTNPYWGGVENAVTAAGLADVLNRRFLDTLVVSGGVAVVYTHLGKVLDRRQPLPAPTREALRKLASYQEDGRILVTTTRRLLDWCRRRREAQVGSREDGGVLRVDVALPDREEPFEGLALTVAGARRVEVRVNDRLVPVRANPPEAGGTHGVSLDWPRLQLPRV